MPYTRVDLDSIFPDISKADLDSALTATKQALDGQYEDEIIHQIKTVREFVDSGQASNYEQAGELLAVLNQVKSSKSRSSSPKKSATQEPSKLSSQEVKKPGGQKVSKSESKEDRNTGATKDALSFTDLLKQAKEILGLTLTLKQVLVILETAGLADKEYYSQGEANRFLIACGLVIKAEAVDIGSQLQEVTAAMETGLIGLVDAVTSQRAKHTPELVKQLYLRNVVMTLAEHEEDIEAFFMQLKDSIIKGVEGKSPLSSILETQWTLTPPPSTASPISPNQSLPRLESETSIYLGSESKSSDNI
jgi:hypothetical protein